MLVNFKRAKISYSPKTKMEKLSIIIPACNEENRIQNTLDQYIVFFTKNYQEFELILVPNGCEDGTEEIVREYSKNNPNLKYKTVKEKIGKGGALIEGFKVATGNIISFVDADGATSPQALYDLVKKLEDNDGVIGSRWMKGANILIRQSWKRRMASRGFNLLVRVLFGLPFKDTQCGAKVFRARIVKDIVNEVGATDFSFDVDLLYKLKKRGYEKIEEVPITWEDQTGSTLKLKKMIPLMFLSILRLRLLNSSLKFLVKNKFVTYLYQFFL